MSIIDVSGNVVRGGFFVLAKSPPTPFSPSSPTPASEEVLVTYPDSGMPIRDALLSMIRGAKRRVFIASFMLGDEELIKEMIAAAHRMRGGVYLITALDDRSLRKGLKEYEESEQESPEERKKNFERLTSAGVYVRGHESCHAKFAVVDDRIAIVGSANFVTKAFNWTGEANAEIHERDTVAQLAKLFATLWYEGCTWEVPPNVTYLVAKRHPSVAPHTPSLPEGVPGELVWTNGSTHTSLLDAIRSTVRSATQDLVLATYSIVQMQARRELLFDDIVRAASKGVRVRLFVRQRNAYPDQMEDLVALHAAGVSIHGDTRNHAKVAIADGADAVLFSANFDGIHGLDSGVEVGYRLRDAAAVKELSRYLEHAMAHADTRFCLDPSAKDLDGHLAARWCKEWSRGDELLVRVRSDEFSLLRKETSTGPCLYEVADDSHCLFYAGNAVVSATLDGRAWNLTVQTRPSEEAADARLREWMRSIRFQGNRQQGARGIFAGRFRVAEGAT
jgi:phosphatidylserine/phosphatidylglycerophosphate/cardiolipin synthase-like enzyme